ncbi:hypothetical protein [Bradyrhizobium cosmicum]|uniref:hypothetical protein n=1 Tax=Bradyrhizobium cosmicum TaxID=1404864 RepID=UPI001162E80A|nr:hypothetical protein [Bradyrhizobium cosmicum]QDP20666.1 hypothetical protein FNV92_00205 [Bradyrhizobium cosmicum]QDP27018.1 hypothetical protein FNV92_34910 [Bradyrhizobium cosmicum]
MTADEALDMLRRQLDEHGEDVIIRRWSGPANARVSTEAIVRGRPVGLKAEQLVGSIRAGDCKVIVINDPAAKVLSGKVALSALLPLTTNDKIEVGGRELAIKYPDDMTRRVAGVVTGLDIFAGG